MTKPESAVEFLVAVTPAGINGTVVAIDPAARLGHGIEAQGYVGGASMNDVQAFLDGRSDKNLYWTPNALKQPLNKKAKKEDFHRIRWIHLDKDDPSPGSLAAIRSYGVPPTLIVASGGGYNAYWSLAEPVPAERAVQIEVVNKRVIADLAPNDKGTQDISRILRLPFTMNWPTASKIKKNPDRQPVKATIVEYHPDRVYGLDAFVATVPALAPVATPTTTRHTTDRSRSGALVRKVAQDRVDGLSPEEVLAKYVETDPHAIDQKDAERAVQRAIDLVWKYSDTIIAEVNAKHALIWVSGKLLAMWPDEFEGGMPRLSQLSDLKVFWKDRQLGKTNPIDLWVGSDTRREFRRLVTRPGNTDTSPDFNLFRGWGVEPDADGDCSLFLNHIREVICDDNPDLYDYVIQWLANSVQQPLDKPGTALTMQSDQGAGKGQFGAYIGPIYGNHYAQVLSSEMLFGRFNDWLAGKIMVFGDEATWPGDRRGVDKLKALITEPNIMVDRKNIPAMTIESFVRFIFATNHEHSAPAEISDRRFVVLTPSNKYIGKHDYWKALVAERENGGPAALLHFLLQVKLTRNLRVTPKTTALAEQKLLTLDDVGRFWRDMLMENDHYSFDGSKHFAFDSVVEPRTLHVMYLDFAKSNHIRSTASIDSLGAKLKKYLPPRRKARRDDLIALGLSNRAWVYDLPTLAQARSEFEEKLGSPVDWPSDDDEKGLLD